MFQPIKYIAVHTVTKKQFLFCNYETIIISSKSQKKDVFRTASSNVIIHANLQRANELESNIGPNSLQPTLRIVKSRLSIGKILDMECDSKFVYS